MKRKNILLLVAAAFLGAVTGASAQIPLGYYSSLKGKKGAQLKTAVYQLVKKAQMLDYGSGQGHTWDGFYTTDRLTDGQVCDRYSPIKFYFPAANDYKSVSGMNIEHSFPKSWWGGSQQQAYFDLYNLMPCEQKTNSAKSNYPMGKVEKVTYDNGMTKIGTGTNGYKLWEPADEWKGDFARGYMYMATAYQDYTWKGEQGLQILEQGDYPTLRSWAYELFLQWARADKPTRIEIDRNEAVAKIQGNRNPYVDFPNLMEYVWGDSTNYAFDPATTVKSNTYTDGGGTVEPDDNIVTVYEGIFTTDDGGCTAVNVDVPEAVGNVWSRDAKYGWKATAYKSKTNYPAEATLTTPKIDLTGYSEATVSFDHALNFAANPSTTHSVEVLVDGVSTPLSGVTWPSGSSWKFVSSGDVSLKAFAGKKIQLVFRYRSTASQASTWEIQSLVIKAHKDVSAIHSSFSSNINAVDLSRPYQAFTTDGRSIAHPETYRGIIIVRQGNNVVKMVVR